MIVIGMHRSGTSMLAHMLAELGLFIGARIDHNAESPLFLALERRLLRRAGGCWQHPQALTLLLEDDLERAAATDYLHRALNSPRISNYLGWSRYRRYRTPANLDVPWGWKSPVSTYTLPLWLQIFPEARVIHIYRHGVDVAQSLRVRAKQEQEEVRRRHVPRALLERYWPLFPLERGFSLWEAYVSEASRHVRDLRHRAVEFAYEDVLADPTTALRSIVAFCDLPATEAEIARVAARVRPERAYAYCNNAELRRFAETVALPLHALGYSATALHDSGWYHARGQDRSDAGAAVAR